MWGGYRTGVRSLDYEVTMRTAGFQGGRGGECVFVCFREVWQRVQFFPPLDLYVSSMNLGQDTGSGV